MPFPLFPIISAAGFIIMNIIIKPVISCVNFRILLSGMSRSRITMRTAAAAILITQLLIPSIAFPRYCIIPLIPPALKRVPTDSRNMNKAAPTIPTIVLMQSEISERQSYNRSSANGSTIAAAN